MKEIVASLLEKETNLKKEQILNLLEVPPSQELGDFAFPCFSLAKIEKKNPMLIAENLAEKLRKKLPKEISNVDFKTGYVNFFLNKKILAEKVLKEVLKKGYGRGNEKSKIIIDYSAPNVAKHFGIHNLRSTLIGHALYNILNFSGNKITSINHLGDWGTQFGKLIVGYKKWGNSGVKDVESLNKLYIKFHEECDKGLKEELEEQARREFKKLEDEDKENLKLWKKFVELSMKEFDKVYKTLGIKFDITKGESFYLDKTEKVIKQLENLNLLEKSEGAKVVRINENIPPCIIEKSDEASTYASRDLAAIQDRLTQSPDKILYVVDFRQSLHFEQIFAVAKKMGIETELKHIKFGIMKFKDMEMSTRKGKVILFEDLLSKAEQEILKIINQKNPKLKNKEITTRKVALAAIIFADLQNNRTLDVVFDWEQALSFEGKTGPYILYTYARANSILKKVKKRTKGQIIDLKKQEISLIKKLENFPEKVKQSSLQYSPHILAEYSFELAQTFNEFYHACPVLGDKQEAFRLQLIEAFKSVMKQSLNLLGIEEVDEM
jgi:arginyl-tRNA synthetase